MSLELLCVFFMATSALAHGHNLSTGKVKISSGHLEVRITFAEDEVRKILPLDRNGDGVVSPEELTHRQQCLDALAPQLWKVVADGRPVALRSCRAVLDVRNDLHFDLSYDLPNATNIVIHSEIIRKMVGFHRQIMFFNDAQDKPCQEDVLLNPNYDTMAATDGKFVAQATAFDAPKLIPQDDSHDDNDSHALSTGNTLSNTISANEKTLNAQPH